MKIKSPKDFWSGVMFLGFGLFFMIWAMGTPHWLNELFGRVIIPGYTMGTAVRMGPAYFPTVLGGLLALLGLIVLAGSLAMEGPKVPQFHFRPLIFVTLGVVLYGYLMKPLGLVLTTGVLVYVSAFGGHEFKWKEVTILFVLLAVFSWAVFVKGLTLPFPIWPAAFE